MYQLSYISLVHDVWHGTWPTIRLAMLLAITISFVSKSGLAETLQFGSGEFQFEMEFVTVGNPGNAPDDTGDPNPVGAVAYTYSMGKYEVSRDMIDKVNASSAIDGTGGTLALEMAQDPRELAYAGIRNPQQPATSMDWLHAMRFANWLNTYVGLPPAYNFRAQPGDVDYAESRVEDVISWVGQPGYDESHPFRNRLARFFVPTLDEWYKAAYHNASAGTDGVYFDYPTGSNTPPIPVASGSEPGTAVYDQVSSNPQLPWNVGPAIVTLAGGPSPYGTIGQGGNARELQESFPRSEFFWRRGGFWGIHEEELSSSSRVGGSGIGTDEFTGFRIMMLGLLGDFNGDGLRTPSDMDLLDEQVRLMSSNAPFDLTLDGIVDQSDRTFWIEQIAGTRFGDADLNGSVEFADFLQLSANFNLATGWAGGDFDGNGMAEFADFLLLADNFGHTRDVSAVPEPGGLLLGLLGLCCLGQMRRGR